jgi:hypothetical protein
MAGLRKLLYANLTPLLWSHWKRYRLSSILTDLNRPTTVGSLLQNSPHQTPFFCCQKPVFFIHEWQRFVYSPNIIANARHAWLNECAFVQCGEIWNLFLTVATMVGSGGVWYSSRKGSRDNTAINCITVQHKNVSFSSTLTVYVKAILVNTINL